MALSEILALLETFRGSRERTHFEQYGPTVCPHAKFNERHLDFRLTQISDCVVVSAEVSPAGVINLLSYCATVVVGFLLKGVMCRGYVTRGPIYDTDTHVIGTGYQAAFAGEAGASAFKKEADEHGTPNTAIVKGYNALCGAKVKLGRWDEYLAMRRGMLALNEKYRDLLSNDLGALAGALFDIGTGRYKPPPHGDAALAEWEADLARVREEASLANKAMRAAREEDRTHTEIQGWLRDLGRALGFEVWVASNDRNLKSATNSKSTAICA